MSGRNVICLLTTIIGLTASASIMAQDSPDFKDGYALGYKEGFDAGYRKAMDETRNAISRFRPETEFRTDERCAIVEIHNRDDDPHCSIARARVAPGVTTRLHALSGTVERYVIIEGEGAVEVAGGAPATVRALDVVAIAAGAPQRITNTGSGDLVLLCVCTPRFRQAAYAALE